MFDGRWNERVKICLKNTWIFPLRELWTQSTGLYGKICKSLSRFTGLRRTLEQNRRQICSKKFTDFRRRELWTHFTGTENSDAIFARKNFRNQRNAHKTEFQNAQKFSRDANEKNKSTTCTWNRPRILRIDFPKNAKNAFFKILPNFEGKIQKSELPYTLFIRKTVVLRINI